MDPLTGLLDGPHARAAFVLRLVMASPWSVDVRDEAPLTVAAVLAGELWVTPAEGPSRLLRSGEIGLVRGPDHYRFASAPDAPAEIVIHPGQRCEDIHGRRLEEPFTLGVRTWGNAPEGATVVLIGTYEQVGETGRRLLAALPPLLAVDGVSLDVPVVELLAAEAGRDVPGQGAVLDRLLDLLTVSVLRRWFTDAGAGAPGWWRAAADPVVGPAIRLIQHNPAHPWTVAELAGQVGASRAAFARRFGELVGQPPMTFLTEWRLAVAADRLLEPGTTVDAVAAEVGYGSGFALSAAFKRVRGMSPSAHRVAGVGS
ncbi:MAG: AraC family transcriptional regulator [Acidimicrobiales bacterium]